MKRLQARLFPALAIAAALIGGRPGFVLAGTEGGPWADEYRIGPEDVLDVTVWNHPDVARTVPVRPDGRISLPLVNDVVVAGLTATELRDLLTQKFTLYFPSPEISIIVREIHSFKVSVMGNVRTPGRFELKSRTTVLDALALAGGFTEFAERRRVVVLRHEGSAMKRLRFDYDDSVSESGSPAPMFLRPGDVVVVP
jgi:polysaccharide export outer membrane protein